MDYATPTILDEALTLRAQGPWRILAGGTDVYPSLAGRSRDESVLDISYITELQKITCDDDYWRIGALVTWRDIWRANLPSAFNGLKQAAAEVGGIQVQNAGTIAGNLCNASPAADGVPPLLVLDAEVELRSVSSTRRLSLETFLLANRKTALSDDEIMTSILIPRVSQNARSSFVKLGARRYLVISIAMAAASVSIDSGGNIENIGIAIGACSATAQRLRKAESRLVGKRAEPDFTHLITSDDLTSLSPIDDLRATAEYRHVAALEIVQRAVRGCLS